MSTLPHNQRFCGNDSLLCAESVQWVTDTKANLYDKPWAEFCEFHPENVRRKQDVLSATVDEQGNEVVKFE